MLSDTAVKWLEERGLDVELAVRLGIESSVRRNGGEVIVIPYFVGTDKVNHKYRTLADKRFSQDAGATKCFWNYNAIVDQSLADKPLIITEGEFDAMAAMQCGYNRVVSVPDGAPSQEQEDRETRKYSYLEHAKSALRDVREIILAVDSDPAGLALLNDLSRRIGKARCKWIKYPKGCKDLNDTLMRYGEKGVHAALQTAQWCEVDGVYRMSELPPYLERQQYSTGMSFLDENYRIRMGDLCVVTGIPGQGKTTFVNDIACRVAEKHNWTVAIASFEQHPQADHRRALREWYLERPLQHCLPQDLERADKWIDEHFVFIVPSEDDFANLEWTLDKCATAVIRYGARMVIIDPWNELDHDRPPDMSLTEYTGKAIKAFKGLARRLDVHVIVVAHPTKLAGGEIPSLYSISDSAHWANKPDVGIVIWKENMEDTTSLCWVRKSRYHDQIGRPGKTWMNYNPILRRFSEGLEPESQRKNRSAA